MNREQAQCLLGVAVDETREDVVSAHRRLISTVHLDKCSGPEAGRLARQATAARDVLLAPAESSSPSRRKTPPPVRTERVVDDGLRCLRVLVHRVGRPVATSLFGLGGVGCSGVMMGAVANGARSR